MSGTPPTRLVKMIGTGYFETMGNPVVAGRAITWSDIHQNAAVAVISENLAREYWGEPSKALGKRLGGSPDAWTEIVGVVGNERLDGLNRPAPTIVYWPMANNRDMAYVVRSPRVGRPGFLRELQQALRSVSPDLPLAAVRTLAEIERQAQEIERQRRNEETALPENLDYSEVRGLSTEARQRLSEVRPATLGQAARVPGITPAAVSLLLIHLKKRSRAA